MLSELSTWILSPFVHIVANYYMVIIEVERNTMHIPVKEVHTLETILEVCVVLC